MSPVRTENLTASQGSILNYDDYTYYCYDYDGAGFEIHIDFEKLAQGSAFTGNNYIILSYDVAYCKGDWLLKGIAGNAKKTLEQFEYKKDAYTGRIVIDCQNITCFVLLEHKGAETRNPIKPKTGATQFSSTVAGKQLMKMKKENAVAKVDSPAWFKDAKGSGVVVHSTQSNVELEAKCFGDGNMRLWLRGMDCRDSAGKRYPVWICVTCFCVDGKEVFNSPHLVCHDKPFVYNMKVTNGQFVRIYMEWQSAVDIIAKERESNLKYIEEVQQKTINLEKTVAETEKKLRETQQKVTKLEREKTKTEKELKNVKNGWSFKIGRIITYIPRIIIRGHHNN